tara:strand:+ start:859 stop:1053 length:195 start_codon:yes stop_codon:yes gene_type:complete
MQVGDLIRFTSTYKLIRPDEAVGIIVGEVYTDSDGDQCVIVHWNDLNKRHDEEVINLEVVSSCK